MNEQAPDSNAESAVATYKQILKRVLDNRPSGTRQRLAQALGKNRSFVSQIANPAYTTPIPVQHLQRIFEICHFSLDERREFLDLYATAHPRRHLLVREVPRQRSITVTVPDFGDARKNQAVDDMIADFARRLARLSDDLSL
jgi:transcriptional regulator with XRE-family HTH domain